MTHPNPIVNAIENLGGSATVQQISNATALKHAMVAQEMESLVSAGLVTRVGGSVWRVSPERMASLVTPTAKTEKAKLTRRKPTKRKSAAAKRRTSPVSGKVIAALETLGGTAAVADLAVVTGFARGQVSDACYKLKKDGFVSMPANGVYTLAGHKAPQTPSEPVAEAPAPDVAPEPVTAPEAIVEAPEAPVERTTGEILDEALAVLLPNGVIPVEPKVLRAVAKFVESAERVLKLTKA